MKMVMTGAAGSIGRSILPALIDLGHEITCLDVMVPADARGTWIRASITDQAALEDAFAGTELVIHLAGLSSEASWEQIVAVNINGTQAVLDAAHRSGVTRVLLASSVHAAGFVSVADAGASATAVRPDTFYGVSKATGEALGGLYADRFGMRVISARIMTFGEQPRTTRALSTWLSPADTVRLITAAATFELPGHHIVWGVSKNTRCPVSLERGHRIGFFPEDDAEAWADQVEADAGFDVLGGPFTDDAHPVGVRWN